MPACSNSRTPPPDASPPPAPSACFVDGLGFAGARLSTQSRQEIDARFADVAGTQAVLERTSHVLASLSSGVGVAIASMPGNDQLEHVHFSRLAPARVLAVVVTRGGVVRDRVLALDQDLSITELGTAANFLNENFRGWEIERIRVDLRLRVEREQREYQRLMNSIEQLWAKAVPQVEDLQTAYVEGVANLVGAHPMGGADDRERLREMMSALETKQRLVDLLNAYIDARQESVRVSSSISKNRRPRWPGSYSSQLQRGLGAVMASASARLGSSGPSGCSTNAPCMQLVTSQRILERQGLGL